MLKKKLTISPTAPRLPHADPQQMRRLQRRSLPILLRTHSRNARTPDPSRRRHLARTTTRRLRPSDRRPTQRPTRSDPRLGAGRLRPRPESSESCRSEVVREKQAHLPDERVGGLRSSEGLFRWRKEGSRGKCFLLFGQVIVVCREENERRNPGPMDVFPSVMPECIDRIDQTST
jgi:hypothetical protein